MPAPKDPEKYKQYIQKLKESHKGQKPTEKQIQGSIKKHKGVPLPEDHRKKISLSEKGKIVSEESRKKMRAAPRASGPDHPMFGKHHSEESRLKMSLSRKGEKAWNWNGGSSFEPYCPKFNNEFKERVRAFFKYTCQICGHVWQEGERKLTVHHVNYRKKSCCDPTVPRLFVPVCTGKCHNKTNFNRDEWEKHFTELIMTKFNGQCYLPKEGGDHAPERNPQDLL